MRSNDFTATGKAAVVNTSHMLDLAAFIDWNVLIMIDHLRKTPTTDHMTRFFDTKTLIMRETYERFDFLCNIYKTGVITVERKKK